MARITVEDCLENVDNRFDLVIKAGKRARRLAIAGEEPMLEWENDKPTVMALREIAAGHSFVDQPDDDLKGPRAKPIVGMAASIEETNSQSNFVASSTDGFESISAKISTESSKLVDDSKETGSQLFKKSNFGSSSYSSIASAEEAALIASLKASFSKKKEESAEDADQSSGLSFSFGKGFLPPEDKENSDKEGEK